MAKVSEHAAADDDDDDPSQSLAARCITFHHLNKTFGPEFTHQCFDGEWIRGYLPQRNPNQQHKSYVLHHEEATHTLQVDIHLSPSCQLCSIETDIQRRPVIMTRSSRKRQRLIYDDEITNDENKVNERTSGDNDDEEVPSSSSPGDTDSDFEDTEQDGDDYDAPRPDNDAAGRTRARRMPAEEILKRCGKGLPKVTTWNACQVQDDFLEKPIGEIIKEYTRNGEDFAVTVAHGNEEAEYHNQVQNMALWFIETADPVDTSSGGGNLGWKILYLFQKVRPKSYAFVGYMTLYFFISPFKQPKPGLVVRICQVLILPSFQRMGHGKNLLRTVYELQALDKNIVEFNVEDPAPAFCALRNRVDYERFQESLESDSPWITDDDTYCLTSHDLADAKFFTPLSDKDAFAAGGVAGITPRQVQIAYELYKLNQLPEQCDEDVFKSFRLMVKKRLIKLHREELGAVASKEEKQAFLGRLFDETYAQYKAILKRA